MIFSVFLAIAAALPLDLLDQPLDLDLDLDLPSDQTIIPNQYIIVLKDHFDSKAHEDHHTRLSVQNMKTLMSDAYEELFRFHIPGFVGYAARFPPDLLNWLQNHHDVDFIEQDRTILLDTFETKVQTKCPAWGLKRIARRQWNHNDSTYIYPESAGTGVDAYIIDTVISHNY
jgi:hypothetical protein